MSSKLDVAKAKKRYYCALVDFVVSFVLFGLFDCIFLIKSIEHGGWAIAVLFLLVVAGFVTLWQMCHRAMLFRTEWSLVYDRYLSIIP